MDAEPPNMGMDGPTGNMPEKPEMPKLSAEMLPPGAKAGDKLILGTPDEDGMFPVTLEASPEKEDTGQESWENDFRKHMSPMEGETEAA